MNKYGGTVSNTYQINAQNLTTENLIVRGNVVGTVNLDVANINIANIGITNYTGNTSFSGDLGIGNDLIFASPTSDVQFPSPYGLRIYQPDPCGNSVLAANPSTVISTLSLDGSSNTNIFVQSHNTTTLNTIAQNTSQYGVQVGSDALSASVYFYNGSTIVANTSTPTQDSSITSQVSSQNSSQNSILSVNRSLNVYSTNIANTQSAVFINDYPAPNKLTDSTTNAYSTADIYSRSPYEYAIYNNSNISTGNALDLFATDNSSVTFLNVTTPNCHRGFRVGGGVYADPSVGDSRSVASLDVKDICGNYRPIQTVVTNSDPVINTATMGINTHYPLTDLSYALDVNGKMILHNTQVESVLHIINNQNQISGTISTAFSKTSTQAGITCYYSSLNSVSTLNVWYTQTGGKQWAPSIVPANTIGVRIQTCVVYDNNYSIILVSNNSTPDASYNNLSNQYLLYYSADGGQIFNGTTITDPSNVSFSSVYFIGGTNSNVITFGGNNTSSTVASNYFQYYDITTAANIVANTGSNVTIPSLYINQQINNGIWTYYNTTISASFVYSDITVDYNYNSNYLWFIRQANPNSGSTTTDTVLFTSSVSSTTNIALSLSSTIASSSNVSMKMLGTANVIYNNTSLVYVDTTSLVSPIYHATQFASVNDAFIISGSEIIVASGGSALFLSTNSGVSYNTHITSFANYGGRLFANDGSFNRIYFPNTGDLTTFFISKTRANNETTDYWCYNPYVFMPPNSYSIMDICGGVNVFGNLVVNGSISATTFVGSISGNSVSSTYSYSSITTSVSDNYSYYPTFALNSSGTNPINVNNSLRYNPSTGELTATTFNGNLNGSVSSATYSSSALTTAVASGSTVYYPTFVSATTGTNPINVYSSLTYNSSANALTATAFNGSLIGNTSSASSAVTTAVSNNANYYPALLSSSSSGTWPIDVSGGLTYNPSTGVLRATTFYGDLSGTINVHSVSDGGTYYPIFTSTVTGTSVGIDANQSLSYVPSTGALTATTFYGSLSGTASSANSAATTAVSTNATYYPTFVSATTGNNPIDVSGGLTYNPSTGALTAATFNGNLSSSGIASCVGISSTGRNTGFNNGSNWLYINNTSGIANVSGIATAVTFGTSPAMSINDISGVISIVSSSGAFTSSQAGAYQIDLTLQFDTSIVPNLGQVSIYHGTSNSTTNHLQTFTPYWAIGSSVGLTCNYKCVSTMIASTDYHLYYNAAIGIGGLGTNTASLSVIRLM